MYSKLQQNRIIFSMIINTTNKLMDWPWEHQHLQYWRKHIQYPDHKQIYSILIKYQIIGYSRYVNDISIIFDQMETNKDETLTRI